MRIEQQHVKAATALARGWTMAEAAKAANVCERTLRTWKEDPDFLNLIEEGLDEQTGARANALTPLVIQFAGLVSQAGNSVAVALPDDAGPRTNLAALVSALEKLVALEKDDAPSRNMKQVRTRAAGLNDDKPEPAPREWDPTPIPGLDVAVATPSKAIRDAETE